MFTLQLIIALFITIAGAILLTRMVRCRRFGLEFAAAVVLVLGGIYSMVALFVLGLPQIP